MSEETKEVQQPPKKKKNSTPLTILLFLIFLGGLSLVLYPTAADYWNSLHQSHAIAEYAEQISNMDEEEYEKLWNEAWEYNSNILRRTNLYVLSDEQQEQYNSILNVSGNGVMGYIQIPSIDVELPIYHGTSDTVLQVAVGHLEWTSLPVGGEGSHCVLSGHRGLPSAKLFTNLDKLVEGDVFYLVVLGEVLTYEVDQVLIVLPSETDDLQIIPGEDLVTLVTCTPYGINTHRMLVRGHRIETEEEVKVLRVTSEGEFIDPMIVVPVVAIPILVVLIILVMVVPSGNRKKRQSE